MKQPKPNTPQLLLPHLQPDRPPADLPAHKQRDLASALAELLLKGPPSQAAKAGQKGNQKMNPKLTPERLSRRAIV